MKIIAIGALLLIQASSAYAIDRMQASASSCSAIQSNVQRSGSVILQFRTASPSSPPLYDLYAKGQSGCGAGKYPETTTVATRDDPNCSLQVCRTNWGRNNR